jgi:hypothetical protein
MIDGFLDRRPLAILALEAFLDDRFRLRPEARNLADILHAQEVPIRVVGDLSAITRHISFGHISGYIWT